MLYIVATPIGNLEDITLRAIRILKEADFVLAEDTRKTGFLLAHFGVKKPLVSFFEHSEVKKIPWVVEELKKGKNLALVSDAGTPTLSDPGYKLVRECRYEKLPITIIPGPSSVAAALSGTSIPHDKFIFLGYLPRKHNERVKLIGKLKGLESAIVFFESPFRILSALQDIKEVTGNVKIAIARELTKKFEEVVESNIEEAILRFEKAKPRGEFVVILDGKEMNVTS
ncbi:MAG: 16S rRNA (cytidine(1402)-2'-O)-methyltransferase [Candidatus Omnitrophica bacterium]|jgi:16S rRNA (cytidine1402-2'-O)-methyltransferase|nr:16S rRNA (cytidine(1402)-2'-O)-methyltransferase [Candidatus Omnitrophota bacterium]